VTTAGGESALLFLFFFFSAALTAETAATTTEADCFPPLTWSCAVSSQRHQHSGPPQHRHPRPPRRYPRWPPPTSLICKTPTDDLLEACTYLT
jgi:hypothetical protein